MTLISAPPTTDTLVRAFPRLCRTEALIAAERLQGRLVEEDRARSILVVLAGEELQIPQRLRLRDGARPERGGSDADLMLHCLLTRSGDGREREAAARVLAQASPPWTLPFLLVLAADHVAEVARAAADALPRVDRAIGAALVRENRPLMRRLRAEAARHWDERYRAMSPQQTSPGVAMLHDLERWAAA